MRFTDHERDILFLYKVSFILHLEINLSLKKIMFLCRDDDLEQADLLLHDLLLTTDRDKDPQDRIDFLKYIYDYVHVRGGWCEQGLDRQV